MSEIVKLVICSKGRAGRVCTHEHITGCAIAVVPGERDKYHREHPELEIIVLDHEVEGLPATREWLYRKIGNVFMLDDDCVGMFRIYRQRKDGDAKMQPSEVYDRIQETGRTAHELGAFLFGFGNHAQPMTYREHKPVRFGGYIAGGGLGLLKGSELSWPTDTTLPIDDWWISLLNAYHHRYAFIDCRFALGFNQTYAGIGGMAAYRGKDSEMEATVYLQKAFGDCVQLQNRAVVMKTSKATWRQKNKYKRKIVLPWGY